MNVASIISGASAAHEVDRHRSARSPATTVTPASTASCSRRCSSSGGEVTSVLDLEELLAQIPELIARLTKFDAFAVYLLDERRGELHDRVLGRLSGASVARTLRVKLGQGLVGAAVAEASRSSSTTCTRDPRYVEAVPGMNAELVVPLRRKGRRDRRAQPPQRQRATSSPRPTTRCCGSSRAHVAVAHRQRAAVRAGARRTPSTLETLAEIGRELASILDLDELFTRIAQPRRAASSTTARSASCWSTRTRSELEMKVAVQYGEQVAGAAHRSSARGSSATPRCTRSRCSCPTCRQDPRYINVVDDVRSELVIPMLLKDRCIGVFDLESPELDAFTKRDVEILTLLASQAAVAIENARLYETVRAQRDPAREGNALRAARAGGAAADRAAQAAEGRRRRRRASRRRASSAATSTTSSRPSRTASSSRVGDVSGKGVPAALYSAFAGELVRGRARSGAATRRTGRARPACSRR